MLIRPHCRNIASSSHYTSVTVIMNTHITITTRPQSSPHTHPWSSLQVLHHHRTVSTFTADHPLSPHNHHCHHTPTTIITHIRHHYHHANCPTSPWTHTPSSSHTHHHRHHHHHTPAITTLIHHHHETHPASPHTHPPPSPSPLPFSSRGVCLLFTRWQGISFLSEGSVNKPKSILFGAFGRFEPSFFLLSYGFVFVFV